MNDRVEKPASHYEFLDGLRGLAAAFIVIFHVTMDVDLDRISPWAARLINPIRESGHCAVAVFIVLSGYCLMLPVANDPAGRLRGGVWGYLWRRARRILPPYYTALALCLALVWLIPMLRKPSGGIWDHALPALWPRMVVLHIFLVHNLWHGSALKIDPPMWSVATEWQIYFLFPMLLAVWRKWGMSVTLAAGFLVSWTASLAMGVHLSAISSPHYAGVFCIGMAAAASKGRRPGPPALAADYAATLGTALVFFCLSGLARVDVLVGAVTAGLLTSWARLSDESGPRPAALKILESRALLAMGAFSYSLYLIHFPVVALSRMVLAAAGWSPDACLFGAMATSFPASLGVAYLFHLAFERPFMSGRPRALRAAETAAVLDPAP